MHVEIEGLTKRFGRVQALRDVDIDLPSGSRVALIGPNGSGKSTLTRALMGLVSHEGSIRHDGSSAREAGLELARRRAYVPQVAPSLAAPVDELVAAVARVRDVSRESVAELASRLDLSLDEVGSRPFRALSGGMKQKLLIALALASPVDLLVLDEPTASLDVHSRERFFELFESLGVGATVVLCSHRLDEIRRLVTRVVALDEGRVSWEGPAVDYLDARTVTVVEVRVARDLTDPEASAADVAGALERHGFREGHGGWWSLRTDRVTARRLVSELASELGDAVRDLVVRPLERVVPDAESDPEARNEPEPSHRSGSGDRPASKNAEGSGGRGMPTDSAGEGAAVGETDASGELAPEATPGQRRARGGGPS